MRVSGDGILPLGLLEVAPPEEGTGDAANNAEVRDSACCRRGATCWKASAEGAKRREEHAAAARNVKGSFVMVVVGGWGRRSDLASF